MMNFKKHISIVLATLILLANLGLTFSVHYCKDKIAGISIYAQETEPCVEKETSCCAKSASHKSCCSNKEIKVEKNTDDVLVKTVHFQIEHLVLNSENKPNFIHFLSTSNASNEVAFYCDSHAPPLYKLHCQFVFYA